MMQATRAISRLMAGLILALGFSAAAQAQNAFTTGAVNLRAGPGTNYAKIGSLPAGTGVNVGSCAGSWCQIVARGARGWVSRNYLDGLDRPPTVVVRPPPVVVAPPVVIGRPPVWRPRPPVVRPPRPRPPYPRPPRPNCRIAPGYPCR